MWVHIKEDVVVGTISASNEEKWTIRNPGGLGKQVVMADTFETMTPKNTMASTVPHKIALALVTRNCKVLESSQFDITTLAWQVRKTAELTCPQLPKATIVSVPNDKPVPAMTPAAPYNIYITHVTAFVWQKHYVGYPESSTPVPLPMFLGRYMGKESPYSCILNLRSIWWVMTLTENWSFVRDMLTVKWSLQMLITLIWWRKQNPCWSMCIEWSFPYPSF